jgi:hypothetical protein
MPLTIPNVRIENRGLFYTIQYDGRDVFYYKPAAECREFPFLISAFTSNFNDPLMAYCHQKLSNSFLKEYQIKRYLKFYFNRMLKYPFASTYFLDETILDKNGRLADCLLNQQIKRNLQKIEHIDECAPRRTPFTKEWNSEIFELFQLFIIRSELMKGCIEISRSDFEAYLDNDDLRMAYVDVFHPDNRYFYSLEEEFEDQKLTKSDEGFVIIRDEVFQMMFIL